MKLHYISEQYLGGEGWSTLTLIHVGWSGLYARESIPAIKRWVRRDPMAFITA